MACKLFKKPTLLSEFLDICKNNEYFSATTSNALIKNLTFLKHMPILQSNIEKQWSSNTNDEENNLKIYENIKTATANSSLLDKYSMICKRDPTAKLTPFGIIEVNRQEQIDVNNDEQMDSADGKISIQLDPGAKRLTCSYLLTDAQSKMYFYRVPQLRKLWWMKVNMRSLDQIIYQLSPRWVKSGIHARRRYNNFFLMNKRFCCCFSSMQHIQAVLLYQKLSKIK